LSQFGVGYFREKVSQTICPKLASDCDYRREALEPGNPIYFLK
jgi:hypothetical protein